MKSNYYIRCFALAILFCLSGTAFGQNLGLDQVGHNLQSQLERFFPYIAAIIFIFVAFKNLGHFTENDGNPWVAVRNLLYYIIAVLVVVGVYNLVKSKSL